MSKFCQMCRTYAEAYQNKLTSRKVPTDLQTTLDNCEKVMDVFNIVLIRQKIEVEVTENFFKEFRRFSDSEVIVQWALDIHH